MINKKGQATLFVILGIIVIVIGILLVYLNSGKQTDITGTEPRIEPIENLVTDCLESVGTQAITYIGETGGYFTSTDTMSESGIAYYLYEGRNLMPTKNELERQVGLYVDDMMETCTKGFVEFYPEFEIVEEKPVTKVIITDEMVNLKMSYPLVIKTEDKKYNIEDFEAKINARFGVVYNAIYEIMQEQMADTSGVCIFCIYDIADKNELVINSFDYDSANKEILFIVEDDKTQLNGESLLFAFLNKYE